MARRRRFPRIRAALDRAVLGSIERAGWAPGTGSSAAWNAFQQGDQLPDGTAPLSSSVIYSCIATIAQEIARLPIAHYERTAGGGKRQIYDTPELALLSAPNAYQTPSDFWQSILYPLLSFGNSVAIMPRTASGAPVALHPMPAASAFPRVDLSTGATFYSTAPPDVSRWQIPDTTVPARNVMHLRMFTPRHPLIGVSPLECLAWSIDRAERITRSSAAFFKNGARPSILLGAPESVTITPAQAKELATRWRDGYSGDNVGGVAVLDRGIEPKQLTMSALDAAIVDQYRLSVEDGARVYRIPLFMLGDYTKIALRTVEGLQRAFITQTLDFYLSHVSYALHRAFRLPAKQSLEFDVEMGMLRGELRELIEALARGVQGGVMRPNEARRRLSLEPDPDGNDLLVQQQMIPVGEAVKPKPAPSAAPPAGGQDDDDVDEDALAAAIAEEFANAA